MDKQITAPCSSCKKSIICEERLIRKDEERIAFLYHCSDCDSRFFEDRERCDSRQPFSSYGRCQQEKGHEDVHSNGRHYWPDNIEALYEEAIEAMGCDFCDVEAGTNCNNFDELEIHRCRWEKWVKSVI